MTLSTDIPIDASFDPDDLPSNPSPASTFAELAEARLSRRSVLAGGLVAAAGFLTTSLVDPPAASATPGHGSPGRPLLGFRAIPTSNADEVVVPPGYTARPFIPWGTPLLGAYPAFRPGSRDAGVANGNTAAEQAQQLGMHHDGMTYFPLHAGRRGSEHGLLVLNHEYTDEFYLHAGTYVPGYAPAYSAEMVLKSQNAHGVTVAEIERSRSGEWKLVRSARNRRITANTPMQFGGPATAHRLLRTKADPAGSTPLGTLNNCGNGETPWGTYLTCEENFNGYFRVDGPQTRGERCPDRALRRGRRPEQMGDPGQAVRRPAGRRRTSPTGSAGWWNSTRWTPAAPPSSGRRSAGSSTRTPPSTSRRTAASSSTWATTRSTSTSTSSSAPTTGAPCARAVAAPSTRARSTWRGSTRTAAGPGCPSCTGRTGSRRTKGFADQGDVLVKTRLAADILMATPMDRPEWTAVDPRTGTVYVTLTNNTSRGHAERRQPPPGEHLGAHRALGRAPRRPHGHDLRVGPVPARRPGRDSTSPDGSTVQAEDSFGSPDGLWLDPDSRAWIQTDGTQPYGANNQMLAADPYRTDSAGAPEVRRFLTGVVGLRGDRHRDDAGPAHALHQPPAPGRGRREYVAAAGRHRHAPLGHRRRHEGRRRGHRHLTADDRRGAGDPRSGFPALRRRRSGVCHAYGDLRRRRDRRGSVPGRRLLRIAGLPVPPGRAGRSAPGVRTAGVTRRLGCPVDDRRRVDDAGADR